MGKAFLQKECLNWDLMDEQELNSRRGEGSIPDREQHRQRVGGGLKEKNVGEADGGRPVVQSTELEAVGMR